MFKTFDIFGEIFDFNVNGQSKIKTTIGGVISILQLLVNLAIIGYFIFDWANGDHLFLSTKSEIISPPDEPQVISTDMFNLSLVLSEHTPNNQLIPFSFMPLKMIWSHGNILYDDKSGKSLINKTETELGNFIPLKLRNDIKTDNDTYNNSFSSLDWNNKILVTNFTADHINVGTKIQGKNNFFNNFELKYNCEIDPDLCERWLEEDDFISNFNKKSQYEATIYLSSPIFDGLLDDPFKFVIFQEKQPIDLKSLGDKVFVIQLTFKKIIVSTDSNSIFKFKEDEVVEFYSVFIDYKEKVQFDFDPKKKPIIGVDFVLDPEEITIYRRYKKLDEVAASSSSVCYLIFMAAKIFVMVINYGETEKYIIKKTYNLAYVNEEKVTEAKFSNLEFKHDNFNDPPQLNIAKTYSEKILEEMLGEKNSTEGKKNDCKLIEEKEGIENRKIEDDEQKKVIKAKENKNHVTGLKKTKSKVIEMELTRREEGDNGININTEGDEINERNDPKFKRKSTVKPAFTKKLSANKLIDMSNKNYREMVDKRRKIFDNKRNFKLKSIKGDIINLLIRDVFKGCGNNEKYLDRSMYVKFKGLITNDLNIVNMIRRANENEVVKNFLFNKDELNCLSILINRYKENPDYLSRILFRLYKFDKNISNEDKEEYLDSLSNIYDIYYDNNINNEERDDKDLYSRFQKNLIKEIELSNDF